MMMMMMNWAFLFLFKNDKVKVVRYDKKTLVVASITNDIFSLLLLLFIALKVLSRVVVLIDNDKITRKKKLDHLVLLPLEK